MEEAEGLAVKGGGTAGAAVGFDVGAEMDDGFGVHGCLSGLKSEGPHVECGPALLLFDLYFQYTKRTIT